MRVLFDTDVLIAGMVEKHPHHKTAFPWLNKAIKREIEGVVSQHTLAEFYAVLTAFPVHPRISPAAALRLIEENLKSFSIVEMGGEDYFKLLDLMAENSCLGGSVYDGIIGYSAKKNTVDILLTFNEEHFKRLFTDYPCKIQKPEE